MILLDRAIQSNKYSYFQKRSDGCTKPISYKNFINKTTHKLVLVAIFTNEYMVKGVNYFFSSALPKSRFKAKLRANLQNNYYGATYFSHIAKKN
jgi:YHS domain-containing protein